MLVEDVSYPDAGLEFNAHRRASVGHDQMTLSPKSSFFSGAYSAAGVVSVDLDNIDADES